MATVYVVRHVVRGLTWRWRLAFVAGLVFGIGLIVRSWPIRRRCIGFLDVAGRWDPSLALVMGGAIVVGRFGFALAGAARATLLGDADAAPGEPRDRSSTGRSRGSLLFGVGWGLVGFCPGPALVRWAAGSGKAVVFVAAMLAGMAIFERSSARARGTPRRVARTVAEKP